MNKIEPYKNIDEAINSLDNGGKFFKVHTNANDGIIDQSELENVGRSFSDKQQMILFLQMSILKLDESDKTSVFSKLDKDLIKTYNKHKPQELSPSEANLKAKLASNTILTGIPKLIDTNFDGFIMFPIITGEITTFRKTPLAEEYDIYQIKDEISNSTYIVAHQKSFEKFPNKKIVIGGVIKELETTNNEDDMHTTFLDAIYYF